MTEQSVRSGAEIDLLGLRLSLSQAASLGDFLLALAYDQSGKNLLRYGNKPSA